MYIHIDPEILFLEVFPKIVLAYVSKDILYILCSIVCNTKKKFRKKSNVQ